MAVIRPFFSDRDWAQLPASARQSISDAVLEGAWSDAAIALEAGTFDAREDRHLSRTHLVLDAQGWREMTALLAELLDRALAIHTESAGRRSHSDEGVADEVLSSLILMHFARPPTASPAG
jgi:hypothetical protein